jgi:hypothetical protein
MPNAQVFFIAPTVVILQCKDECLKDSVLIEGIQEM